MTDPGPGAMSSGPSGAPAAGPKIRALVVDDEAPLRRALAMNLTARGYDVTEAATGTEALTAAGDSNPDVVLLDLGLPDIGGVDVIRGIRAWSATPIVVLTARTGGMAAVQALDAGADDYVTKPFNMDELLARLRAATRRAGAAPAGVVRVGDVTLDLDTKSAVHADGSTVHLTPTEWRFVEVLLRRPGQLVTPTELLTKLRGGPGHTDPSYLRIYLAQLRRKLEPVPARPRHLMTEPGMGYRYIP